MSEKAALRIIDANANRAREALRVVEEYCRFALNNAGLSSRAKQIRHDLARSLSVLDARRLISSRDTTADVGTTSQIAAPLKRRHLEDCLRAGFKRLSEALRTLAEVIQIDDPSLAQGLESLRYQCYTLEKTVFEQGVPTARFRDVRLYVLLNGDETEHVLHMAEQCCQGGADCLQLRVKALSDRDWLKLAKAFVEICRSHECLSVINDRTDLATVAGADGVHLGLEDMPLEDARRLQLQPLMFGLTTHNFEELSRASLLCPTYVALGPAFPSMTKPDLPAAGLTFVKKGLERLSQEGISHVIIGGIHHDNVGQVCALGATTVAVGACITGSRSPEEACRRLREAVLGAVEYQPP